jgi:hypothetical protein
MVTSVTDLQRQSVSEASSASLEKIAGVRFLCNCPNPLRLDSSATDRGRLDVRAYRRPNDGPEF